MWDWTNFQNIPAVLIVANFNILWTALYIMVIRRGFLDKTFGIPVAALMLNSSWDFINFAIDPMPVPQNLIVLFYFSLQLVIYYQVLRYWRREFPNVSAWQFYSLFVIGLIFSVLLLRTASLDFGETPTWRSGFADTFINSALFIAMFYHRSDLRGQSLYIGLAKLLGSGPFGLGLFLHPWPGFEGSALLPLLYLGIFILDLYYVILVYLRSRQLGINPWRRI